MALRTLDLCPETTSHISTQICMGQGGSAAVSCKERRSILKNKESAASYSKTVADRTGEPVLSTCMRLHPGVEKKHTFPGRALGSPYTTKPGQSARCGGGVSLPPGRRTRSTGGSTLMTASARRRMYCCTRPHTHSQGNIAGGTVYKLVRTADTASQWATQVQVG